MTTNRGKDMVEKLARSISFALRHAADQDAIIQCRERFVLSERAAGLVRRSIGNKCAAVGRDGCYFGSPLQDAILDLARS
jgi:hypothetical protein